MADTFASFAAKLDAFTRDLSGAELKKIMTDAGVEAKKIATKAAAADLGGDSAFSGWRRGSPYPLETRFDHVGEGRISFHPSKRSAGPWTTAEYGRHSKSGPVMTGPKLTKTGKVSKAKQKRWNGRTQGKGTASDAVADIEQAFPKITENAVKSALKKRFD